MLQPLNTEKWFLSQNLEESKIKNIETKIPTCVHLDLLKNKIIEDPYIKQNELQQRWIGKSNWSYSCNFHVKESNLNEIHQNLIFEGIDTICKKKKNFTSKRLYLFEWKNDWENGKYV